MKGKFGGYGGWRRIDGVRMGCEWSRRGSLRHSNGHFLCEFGRGGRDLKEEKTGGGKGWFPREKGVWVADGGLLWCCLGGDRMTWSWS